MKAKKDLKKSISQMSFEQAMERLEEVVEILSSEKIDLELMIEMYEEGSLLKDYCLKKLSEAKMKIETISSKTLKITKNEEHS